MFEGRRKKHSFRFISFWLYLFSEAIIQMCNQNKRHYFVFQHIWTAGRQMRERQRRLLKTSKHIFEMNMPREDDHF